MKPRVLALVAFVSAFVLAQIAAGLEPDAWRAEAIGFLALGLAIVYLPNGGTDD